MKKISKKVPTWHFSASRIVGDFLLSWRRLFTKKGKGRAKTTSETTAHDDDDDDDDDDEIDDDE